MHRMNQYIGGNLVNILFLLFDILMTIQLRESNKGCPLSKFKDQFEQIVIAQWLNAYIAYPSIQYYLFFLKNIYERYHHQFYRNHQTVIQLLPLQNSIQMQLQQVLLFIDLVIREGKQKAKLFLKYKLKEMLFLWEELLAFVIENQFEEVTTHQTFQRKTDVKLLLKILYANILHLKEFIQLNKSILNCVKQAKHVYIGPFILSHFLSLSENSLSFEGQFRKDSIIKSQISKQRDQKVICKQEYLQDQKINSSIRQNHFYERDYQMLVNSEQQQLNILQKSIKSLYSSLIYLNPSQQVKLEEFSRFSVKHTSNKNYFLLGLYIGLGVVILISLIVLLILNFLQLAYDQQRVQSMNYVFPMFRGVGLLILYLWGMAWNVYGFVTYKINFKNILEYGSHYSSHFQIMKRAGFFTLVFCLMLFLYLLGLQINSSSQTRLPIQYSPFVVWVLYFLYIFFPNREVFNPRGRKYFYLLVKKIILSPIVRMSFLLSYASDQLVSFVIPIKDFAYTLCFYTSNFTIEQVRSCLKSDSFDGIIIAYVVALVPLLIRMIQCFNQARQSSGHFIGHLQMWNFGKYSASVLTSTLSFFTSINSSLLPFFIASSVFSTLYSYYWDLKNDWGFLEKKSKYKFLRSHLCYKNPIIYYVAICLNLIFRCSWTLTISPSVVRLIPKSTFLPFLTGLIEILRRCMWNFFRIQKQHVLNCASFTIIKQNTKDIMTRLKAKKPKKSFRLADDTESSIIHYVKLASNEDSTFYRNMLNLGLSQVKADEVAESQLKFDKHYKQQKQMLVNEEQEIKSNILYDIKQKFY